MSQSAGPDDQSTIQSSAAQVSPESRQLLVHNLTGLLKGTVSEQQFWSDWLELQPCEQTALLTLEQQVKAYLQQRKSTRKTMQFTVLGPVIGIRQRVHQALLAGWVRILRREAG